jgi:hypothetical protein
MIKYGQVKYSRHILQQIKDRYHKPIANIIPKGENIQNFLRKGTRHNAIVSSLLYIILNILVRVVGLEKLIKGIVC